MENNVYQELKRKMREEILQDLKREHKLAIVNHKEGSRCPVCDHLNTVKRVALHKTMAEALIQLYVMVNGKTGEYRHQADVYKKINAKSYNLTQFKYYGLIEQRPLQQKNENPKSDGYWGITKKGIDFILKSDTDPNYRINRDTFTFREKTINTPQFMIDAHKRNKLPKMVSISDLLGEPFNYEYHIKNNGIQKSIESTGI